MVEWKYTLESKLLQITPWLFTRAQIIIFALIDFFISFFIFASNLIISFPNKTLFAIAFSLIFVLSSYIFGRYNYIKISYENQFILNIIKTIIVFITTLLFIFLIGLIFNQEIYFNRVSPLLLINIFVCNLIRYFRLIQINKVFKNKSKWIFVGKKEIFNDLIEQSNIGRTKKELIYANDNYIKNLFLENIEGLIYEDINNLNSKELTVINNVQKQNKPVMSLFSWCELYLQRFPSNILIDRVLLMNNFYIPKYSYQQRIKIISEIFISLILLTLFTPLLIILCFLIWITDRGSAFYSQIRVGKNGKQFRIWKLRSMHLNAEENGIKWSSKNDKRITFIGNIIRRTRIDELPQLYSVLKGDMSLIGPRPERPEIEETLNNKIANYKLRQIIRPGISGWAQVNYPYGASIEDSKNKLSFDLYYIKNMSILLDLLIFFKTIKTIFDVKSSNPNK